MGHTIDQANEHDGATTAARRPLTATCGTLVTAVLALPCFVGILLQSVPVTQSSWTFSLPQGGSVTYEERSPMMRLSIAPSEDTEYLTWRKPNGWPVRHEIGMSNHSWLEAKLNKNGTVLWLHDPEKEKLVAAINLRSGEVLGEGGLVWSGGGGSEPDSADWLDLTEGQVIARRCLEPGAPHGHTFKPEYSHYGPRRRNASPNRSGSPPWRPD